jgi:hypothetical protein
VEEGRRNNNKGLQTTDLSQEIVQVEVGPTDELLVEFSEEYETEVDRHLYREEILFHLGEVDKSFKLRIQTEEHVLVVAVLKSVHLQVDVVVRGLAPVDRLSHNHLHLLAHGIELLIHLDEVRFREHHQHGLVEILGGLEGRGAGLTRAGRPNTLLEEDDFTHLFLADVQVADRGRVTLVVFGQAVCVLVEKELIRVLLCVSLVFGQGHALDEIRFLFSEDELRTSQEDFLDPDGSDGLRNLLERAIWCVNVEHKLSFVLSYGNVVTLERLSILLV